MERKFILVTGASAGIGMETAKVLAGKGHIVYGAARRMERLESLKHHGVIPLHMDVTEEASMHRCVETIQKESGGVDVLVNNAGYGSFGAVEDVPLEEARHQFEVNVFGLARLTQLVLPDMRQRRWGRIINVSSVGGKIHAPLGGWYHSTKFALEGLSSCLRMEVEPFGINVVVIRPGAIRSEFCDIAGERLEKTLDDSTYAPVAERLKAAINRFYGSELLSDGPEAVAKVIARSVKAKKPRTAYVVPCSAGLFTGLRWLFPDRCFDSVIRGMFGLPSPTALR